MQKEIQAFIAPLLKEARESWGGQIGEERAQAVQALIAEFLPNWSTVLGIPQLEVIQAIEKSRRVNVINHYQLSNFPLLENVTVYESKAHFVKVVGRDGFRCPSCNLMSTDPYICTQVKCDWIASGLFGCLGKGHRAVVKDEFLKHPYVSEIFMPVALESRA